MQVLFGTLLQPISPESCRMQPRCAVRIEDDGRIGQVSVAPGVPRGAIGDEQCLILPGFVDAHLHVAQWHRRGIDGLPLSQWQEKVGYPAEESMADAEAATALAEQFVSEIVAGGTTTVAAFGTPFAREVEATFSVFARRGLRGLWDDAERRAGAGIDTAIGGRGRWIDRAGWRPGGMGRKTGGCDMRSARDRASIAGKR